MVWVVRGDASGVGNHDSPADIDAAIPVRDLDSRAGWEVADAHRYGWQDDDATVKVPPYPAFRLVGLDIYGEVGLVATPDRTP